MANLIGRRALVARTMREGALTFRAPGPETVDEFIKAELAARRAAKLLAEANVRAAEALAEYQKQAAAVLATLCPDVRPGWRVEGETVVTTGPAGRVVWRRHMSKAGHLVKCHLGDYTTVPASQMVVAMAAGGASTADILTELGRLVA